MLNLTKKICQGTKANGEKCSYKSSIEEYCKIHYKQDLCSQCKKYKSTSDLCFRCFGNVQNVEIENFEIVKVENMFDFSNIPLEIFRHIISFMNNDAKELILSCKLFYNKLYFYHIDISNVTYISDNILSLIEADLNRDNSFLLRTRSLYIYRINENICNILTNYKFFKLYHISGNLNKNDILENFPNLKSTDIFSNKAIDYSVCKNIEHIYGMNTEDNITGLNLKYIQLDDYNNTFDYSIYNKEFSNLKIFKGYSVLSEQLYLNLIQLEMSSLCISISYFPNLRKLKLHYFTNEQLQYFDYDDSKLEDLILSKSECRKKSKYKLKIFLPNLKRLTLENILFTIMQDSEYPKISDINYKLEYLRIINSNCKEYGTMVTFLNYKNLKEVSIKNPTMRDIYTFRYSNIIFNKLSFSNINKSFMESYSNSHHSGCLVKMRKTNIYNSLTISYFYNKSYKFEELFHKEFVLYCNHDCDIF